MNIQTFQHLSTEDIAARIRDHGSKVCVFPINGTRRWFMLEHPEAAGQNFVESYLNIAGQRHLDLYRLFFDHGLDTLLTPIVGPDILERGDGYAEIIAQGLLWFAEDTNFNAFYDAYDVRVRVYGDSERYLRNTPYAPVLDAFEKLAERTASHSTRRLFFGVCGHDPAETVAAIGAQFAKLYGRLPEKREIVESYYGEYVEPVNLFIGFDRPAAFDMPLIATGHEDLYFTVSPSPYMDEQTLRAILYDHLYARRINEQYSQLTSEDWQTLTNFYRANRHHVIGVGQQAADGAIWYPLPQVELPTEWES